MRTVVMSREWARAQACRPPAPPKASRAKSRGSWPRWTLTVRMARSMLELAMRTMPSANVSSGDRPRSVRFEFCGEGFREGAGAVEVERHAAAEEVGGVEPAEEQVGVSDGELGAFAVAGGAGVGAGGAWADAEAAAGVEPRDGAAAGADGMDVEHGQAYGEVADNRVDRVADDVCR